MMSNATTLIISMPECGGRERQHEPVTVGLPLPRSLADSPQQISLIDEHGHVQPLQVIPLEKWTDGSLRWVLLDFQVTGQIVSEHRYTIRIGETTRTDNAFSLSVREDSDQIAIDTGTAQFTVRTGSGFLFTDVVAGGLPQVDAAQSGLHVTDQTGKCHTAHVQSVTLEESGPVRATVRIEGIVGPPRRPFLQVIARIQFFAGLSAVRVAITLRNPDRARHRGGFWELGDPGSVLLKDASLHLSLPSPATRIECAPESGAPVQDFNAPLELYQDSSGGEHWQHVTHLNRQGRVPCTFRGYRLVSGSQRFEGLRATPSILLRHQAGSVGIAVEQFWQNCPKAIEAEDRALIYRLFPRQYADLHELQGGEQKTHRFTLMFGAGASARDDAWFWGRMPCWVRATPSWYCETDAVPYLSPPPDGPADAYESLITAAIEGPDSFERKRENVDEYGWRHFGDLYADHENAFSGEPRPIVSHYNNQYDAIAGFATQFMRTSDRRWWALMDDLAHHVADIDIYHTDRDKAAYNNGLFWHTAHYVDAGLSTHRSYPKSPKVNGGGLSNEHNYASGLMLHYFLTGDQISRESAVGLARWVIAMDDGDRTIFRWLARRPTGLASQTNSSDYHGPGRGAAHSLRALLDGHRLTGDQVFLDKADELIRRVIHPLDDVPARELLDAERRWSYTAFLQALGAYLDYKAERAATDAMYAYAAQSLLHYARWMAVNEFPYLDRPDLLEYPTETWPAQDIRKSDVFHFAACYTEGTERADFRSRGAFFFESAVSSLAAAPTRSFTRPVVLLLTNGRLNRFKQMDERMHPPLTSSATHDLALPSRFVSQKYVAKRRLLGLAGLLLALLGLIPLAMTGADLPAAIASVRMIGQ